jgi:hypothetical protein
MWNQRLEFDVAFCDLPIATRVVFRVVTKEGVACFWAGINLFTYQRELRTGAVLLKMWTGECTDEMVRVPDCCCCCCYVYQERGRGVVCCVS